jgi:hypothetical protein
LNIIITKSFIIIATKMIISFINYLDSIIIIIHFKKILVLKQFIINYYLNFTIIIVTIIIVTNFVFSFIVLSKLNLVFKDLVYYFIDCFQELIFNNWNYNLKFLINL